MTPEIATASEPKNRKRELEEYVGKEMVSSSSQNTSALDVVQLADKVTRWTGIWDRAEINQIHFFCDDKFSHGFEKLVLLSGHVLDLTEGFTLEQDIVSRKGVTKFGER